MRNSASHDQHQSGSENLGSAYTDGFGTNDIFRFRENVNVLGNFRGNLDCGGHSSSGQACNGVCKEETSLAAVEFSDFNNHNSWNLSLELQVEESLRCHL